ncbi:ABC transporter ATP-binding protein [Tsukamurella spumae]|uniref:Fatty acid ABC transporter ATP-binding/permease protein n=1 Tax=Tsukamurella spumae TaxID=44753 RepID=A0A846X416_9ACTN|nr:ABC transporter ATP-binding protein [Tsukamurella spumae]NKY19893.1 ABC transporter ATP-binding protein [Tsukamurella spumae]
MTRPGGRTAAAAAAGAPNQKAMTFWPSLKRLLGRMREQRVAMMAAIVLSIGSVTAAVLAPKVVGTAVDAIYDGFRSQLRHGPGIDFHRVGTILLWVVVLFVASAALQYVQGYLLNGAVQRVMYSLRREVEEKLNRLPLSYFDKQPRGELLSRVTNDIDNLGQSLTQALSQLIVSAFTVIGVLVMMLVVSPLLTAVAVVVIPLIVVFAGQIMKRSQKHFVAQWKSTGSLNAQVEEAFTGHDLVTVYGRGAALEERFAAENDALMHASYRAQFLSGLVMPISMFVGNLQYVAVCVVGGLRVAGGGMSLGDVIAFIQYSRQFTQPVTQMASMVNMLQSGVASAERVFSILDAEEQVAGRPGTLPEPTRGRVAFENVSFGYKPDEPLIEGMNLVAEPGRTVAIVGHTGAGKTTLVNLIMRFYELSGGRITIDGVDIAEVERADLRHRMGMVLQDTWLFEGTIMDNIRYGRLDATDEEVYEAARATFVDRFVHSLPDGYQTVLDDESGSVSAGERQLITIARAFLAEPAILILDEATSSVDTRTEVMLQQAMHALRADRTSFVIAHRLSTIRDADVIVVMDHGRIVEQGSHEELLAAGGHYADLYRAQFEGVEI